MRSFQRIASGVDVGPLVLAISQQPELWNTNRLRLDYPNSPHAEADDIWLRWNVVAEDKTKVIDDLEVVEYPAWSKLPQCREMVLNLMRRVEGARLGRVMVTRLAPGSKIGRHRDQGGYAAYYKRYHIALQSSPGVVFWAGEEQVQMLSGEVWWFDASQIHEVANNSADDRLNLIVDIRSV